MTVFSLILGLASCSTIRKATYPPGFVYLDNEDVHSAMQKMAISIDRINTLLESPDMTPEQQNAEVIFELDQIREATEGMTAGAGISSHRVISDNLGRFRSRVGEARRDARASPPDYQATASLVRECLSCHIRNVGEPEAF